ncbi:MAG: hypothetical protein SGJ23_12780 [Alphaproteobacteria bacterium]|nr:hypothetical protein [Alphaproteobacteria bacterium]
MIGLERAARILKNNLLPSDDTAAGWLLTDLEIAAECFELPIDHGLEIIPKEAADPLVNAADRILSAATTYSLASETEMAAVRRIRSQAIMRAQMKAGPGPEIRPWLWPCSRNFLDVWKRITKKPAGLHDRGEASVALAFVVECCQAIDPDVNASAILRARRAAGPELDDDALAAQYENSGNSGESAL